MTKIKLVGRPGKVVQRGGTFVTVIESWKIPPLPGDLPAPAEAAVKYTVYMDERQWLKVSSVMDNSQNGLVIEGCFFYDAELQGLALLAQSMAAKGQPVQKA